MTKRELIEAVSAPQSENGISKKVIEKIIGDTFEAIQNSIKETGRFSYPNFGTFTVKERAARKGRNPQTGEEIEIKASKLIKFKASPDLKKAL